MAFRPGTVVDTNSGIASPLKFCFSSFFSDNQTLSVDHIFAFPCRKATKNGRTGFSMFCLPFRMSSEVFGARVPGISCGEMVANDRKSQRKLGLS